MIESDLFGLAVATSAEESAQLGADHHPDTREEKGTNNRTCDRCRSGYGDSFEDLLADRTAGVGGHRRLVLAKPEWLRAIERTLNLLKLDVNT